MEVCLDDGDNNNYLMTSENGVAHSEKFSHFFAKNVLSILAASRADYGCHSGCAGLEGRV